MKLTEDQLKLVEEYGGYEYSPEDIAKILQVDEEEFLIEWQEPDTEIRLAYDRGQLITQGKIMKNISSSAESSITAAQEYNKLQRERKLTKLKTQLDSSTKAYSRGNSEAALVTRYEDSLQHYHDLKEWIAGSKEADIMPAHLENYWLRLNTAHDLYMKLHNRSRGRKFIVKLLRRKFPDISDKTAYRYIHEAINFFNVSMTREEWRNVLTEDLEKVKALAWEMNRGDWFIKAVKEQAEIQQTKLPEPEKIDKELLEQRYLLIVNDPQLLGQGAKPVNRNEILKRIKEYDLAAKDKKRLALDAGIEDVDFEEIEEVLNDADQEEISE